MKKLCTLVRKGTNVRFCHFEKKLIQMFSIVFILLNYYLKKEFSRGINQRLDIGIYFCYGYNYCEIRGGHSKDNGNNQRDVIFTNALKGNFLHFFTIPKTIVS